MLVTIRPFVFHLCFGLALRGKEPAHNAVAEKDTCWLQLIETACSNTDRKRSILLPCADESTTRSIYSDTVDVVVVRPGHAQHKLDRSQGTDRTQARACHTGTFNNACLVAYLTDPQPGHWRRDARVPFQPCVRDVASRAAQKRLPAVPCRGPGPWPCAEGAGHVADRGPRHESARASSASIELERGAGGATRGRAVVSAETCVTTRKQAPFRLCTPRRHGVVFTDPLDRCRASALKYAGGGTS